MDAFLIPTGRERDTYENVKPLFEAVHFVVNDPFHFVRLNADGMLQRMSKATLGDMYQNVKLFKEPGAKKAPDFMQKWLTDPTRHTVEKVDFYPPPIVVPAGCFNTFKGFKASLLPAVDDVDVDLAPILHHIDVLVGHAPGGAKYVLDWLAVLLQRPGVDKHMATAILFKGQPGTGKTTFIDWIGREVIGLEHYSYVDNAKQQLFERFSNALDKTILCCIDEAKQLHQFADKFKAYITQTTTMVEVKGIQPVKVNNFARFLMATNNENPIKIEGGDRRFEVFKVSSEHFDDPVYHTYLNNVWMKDARNVRAFYDMLMARDVADIQLQTTRPMTDEFRKMQLLNTPAIVEFLVEAHDSRDDDIETVRGQQFRARFAHWARSNNRLAALEFSARYMTQQFEQYGVVSVNTRIDVKKERGYVVEWAKVKEAVVAAYPGLPLFVEADDVAV